jgi:hypothetical protein
MKYDFLPVIEHPAGTREFHYRNLPWLSDKAQGLLEKMLKVVRSTHEVRQACGVLAKPFPYIHKPDMVIRDGLTATNTPRAAPEWMVVIPEAAADGGGAGAD